MNILKNAQTYIAIIAALIAACGSYYGIASRVDHLDRRTTLLESQKADQTRWITDNNTMAIATLRDEQAKTRNDVAELKAGVGVANVKLDNLVEMAKRDRERHP